MYSSFGMHKPMQPEASPEPGYRRRAGRMGADTTAIKKTKKIQ